MSVYNMCLCLFRVWWKVSLALLLQEPFFVYLVDNLSSSSVLLGPFSSLKNCFMNLASKNHMPYLIAYNTPMGFNRVYCVRNNDVDYMELRLWIGLHSCLQCLLLALSDASYIIKYMTRFTEEGFSSLISFIFISDAVKKMVGTHRQWVFPYF